MARKTFELGITVDRATAFTLPYELASRRVAVFGLSGSGKSNTATVCAEGLIRNGEQVVYIDPKGEGWGLRVGFDGDSGGGLDVVIFGEPHGDLPLRVDHAEQIADFVVDTGQSVVLSLLGFDADADERRFIGRFLKRLYRRKSRQASPIRTMCLFEEAHLVIPEAGRAAGDQAELIAAVKRIGRQGRSAGLGAMYVDQRPADCAKSVITQCELLIVHQLAHKTDRDALKDWVRAYDRYGNGDEFLETLAALQPGEAWVWSPAWLNVFERVNINRRATLDTGNTPDNSKAARSAKLATVNLDQLRGQLAAVVEAAEQADPSKLQAKLKRQESQLVTLQKDLDRLRAQPAADPAAISRAVNEAAAQLTTDWQARISSAVGPMRNLHGDLDSAMQMLLAVDSNLRGLLNGQAPKFLPKPAQAPSIRPTPTQAQPSRSKSETRAPTAVGDLKLGKAHRAILDTLAWWESVGELSPSWERVASVIGKHPRSKGLMNARAELKTARLLDDRYLLTPAGRDAAQVPDIIPTLGELHRVWRGRLKGKERDIFDLVDSAGGRMSWTAICEQLGLHPRTKTVMNARGRLNATYGLTRMEGDELVGTDLMYPEGLR